MASSATQESPRIAKITTSAQQFRELINTLRNRHNRTRHHSPPPSNIDQSLPNNNQEPQLQTQSQQQNSPTPNSNLFQIREQDELGLRMVTRKEVGGRDQLKKSKVLCDGKPEAEGMKTAKKEAGIQFEEGQSKEITSFTFDSPRKNVSIQCNPEPFGFTAPLQSSFLMQASKNNQKAGQIVRQQLKNDSTEHPSELMIRRIRDIHQSKVIEYCRKERLVQKSQPSEIFVFFTNLCLECDIVIASPTIKKFKNCIYFGFPILKDTTYEGFLYFYDFRIYYGQFLNGIKHGLGVELSIVDEIKFKGEFCDGRKSGKFYVQRPTEKYIGYLQNGLYHGEGRLTTADYIYEGLFEQGEKNGYGQEFYPKTGVKISGMFKNGVLAKTRVSRSIAELREKSKFKEKERLEEVRKKSLEKHSARMNRVRSFRQSQYQIDFEPQTDYNELPRLHFNHSKLDVYRQPIQKLPHITHNSESRHHPSPASSRLNSFYKPPKESQAHKPGRNGLNWVSSGNPQRLSSSENEQPLPTPYLSYPHRQQ